MNPTAQGYPPPQQGYPPPQQGYPPPQQGYPPPQQGYAPPQQAAQPPQGYPPPQQGYAPPQQGYQPPQQGYQPPQQTAQPPQQGYLPPQQGYQQPQQGYAPPQQNFPPLQGYPPPQHQQPPPQQQHQSVPMEVGQIPPPPPQQQPNEQFGAAPPTHQLTGNAGIPWGVDQGNVLPVGGAAPAMTKFDGDVPDDDVSGDSDDEVTSPPTADLAFDTMDKVLGYDDVMGLNFLPPPPSYEEATKPPTPQSAGVLPTISDTEAREVLLSHIAEQCCWGKRAAEGLTFTNIEHSAAFHYTLETFSERRTTKWVHVPYVRQPIDGPQNGPAPLPWNIPVNIPAYFQNNSQKIEVAHTASVKPCHNCRKTGYVRCPRCCGRGTVRCRRCGGDGRRRVRRYNSSTKKHYYKNIRCTSCGGDGLKQCFRCTGYGKITCPVCEGYRQLKCYIQLAIEWINHVEDDIVEHTNLPDELIRDVKGQIVFEEEHPKVQPITHFPDNAINQASQRIVSRHEDAFKAERLHKQRHNVRIIPVAEPKCQYGDKSFVFYVYGFERKVYAPEYPMQCCWGCSVL